MEKELSLVVFDMDGTALYQKEKDNDVWRRFFGAAGLLSECNELIRKYHDSETNTMLPERHPPFYEASCKLLAGKEVAPVVEAFRQLPYTAGFLDFCDYLRSREIQLGLATLSIDAVAQKIKTEAGLDLVLANEIHFQNGTFTGTGKINVPFGGKGKAVEKIYNALGVTRETTAFFGDSGNDVEGWQAVSYPFGMNMNQNYGHLVKAAFTDFHQAQEYLKEVFKK